MAQITSTRSRSDRYFYTVNVRLLVASVVVVALTALGGYLWYQYRQAQTTKAILARAEKLDNDGKFSEAAAYYQRYLLADPENTDVLVQLIEVQNQGEPSPAKLYRLNQLLYRTLGRLPEREDLRLMLAENLLTIGEWEDAQSEAKKLLDGSPSVALGARKVIAISQLRRVGIDSTISAPDTVKELIAVAEELPTDHELALITAVTIRNQPDHVPDELGDPASLADRLVDRTLELQPDNVDARMARYQYRLLYNLPDAEADLAAALEVDPNNVDALLASALSKTSPESTAAELEVASTELRSVIDAAPEDLRAYLALVEVLKLQNQPGEAITLLQDVIGRTDEKVELQLALASLQLESNQVAEARSTLERLQRESTAFLARLERGQRDRFENRIRLLTARIELAQQHVAKAITELKTIYLGGDVAGAGRRSPEWGQACHLLAVIYQDQGAWDQAGPYWNALLQAVPGNAAIAEAAAQSALRTGRAARAIEIIDGFERSAPLTENLHVARVRALLQSEMLRAPAERNWHEFEEALQAATALAPNRSELLLAQAERLKAERADEATRLAFWRESEQQFNQSREFWRSAVLHYAELNADADQQRALEHYRELETSPIELALVEAAALASSRDFSASDKLLADAAAKLPANQAAILQRRRIEQFAAQGDLQKAWNEVHKLLENGAPDPGLLRLGAELSLALGNLESAQKWEEKFAEITVNGSDAQALRIKRLLLDYSNLSERERRELSEAIAAVRSERPQWYEIVFLAGRFAELSGDQRQAVEDYRLAVSLGDRRESTLQPLIVLLYGLNLFDEAEQYLKTLASNQTDSSFVNSMGVELAVRRGLPAGAIDTARRSVEQFPQDASRRIYLANLLLAFGNRPEAEGVLRQAAQDLPADPRVWLGLVSYLTKDNRRSQAAEVVATIEDAPGIADEDRPLLLAQSYNLIGNYAAAATHYQAALEREPENAPLRLQYARCLAQRSIRDALSEYEKVLQLEPANQEARSEMAVALAATGNPADWARANQLLEQTDATSATASSTTANLRALLLSQQGRTRADRIAKCEAARKILEKQIEVAADGEAAVSRLMLAQIAEQEANLSGDEALLIAARDQLQQVVDGKLPTVEQQSRYIEFLLRNADKTEQKTAFLDAAAEELEQLRNTLKQGDLGTAALHTVLSAQLSKARGEPAEADAIVEEFVSQFMPAGETSSVVPQLLSIGKVYAAVDNHAAAEKTYRRIFELTPNAYVLVAQSLIDQGKRREAAGFCLGLSTDGLSPEVAQTLAAILTTPDEEADLDYPEAEAALQAAIDEYPRNVTLLQADAIRRASRGDYDAAIETFRKVIALDPKNSLALNNLATLLAEKPDHREEALQLIEQAIQFAGRQPSLLDTEGTILLKLERADEAIVCLEEATAGGIADARYYLHLAAAYHLAHRNEDAVRMLDEARGFGLEKFLLTDDDRRILEELNALKQSTPVSSPT